MDDYAWRDVFDFISPTADDRKKLALISEIGDRRFSGICQKWLHEWTKNVCLGPIRIHEPLAATKRTQNIGHPEMASLQFFDRNEGAWAQEVVPLSLMDPELPINICGSKEIFLYYLDSSVLRFLRRMQPQLQSNKLRITCLCGDQTLEATWTFLGHLLPLCSDGTDTIFLASTNNHLPLLTTIRDQPQTQHLFNSIKSIELKTPNGDSRLMELLLRWLGTRRADGEPRLLGIHSFKGNALDFLERIRQHFLGTTSAASFLISIITEEEEAQTWEAMEAQTWEAIQESTTQNGRTNEQLVSRKLADLLIIGRCPAELDGQKWLTEQCRAIDANYQMMRKLWICFPTLGLIEESNPPGVQQEKEGKEDFDQPGPSKKPRFA